jgi:hypothetical protein
MNEKPRKSLADHPAKVGPTDALRLQLAADRLCDEEFDRMAAQVDAHLGALVLETPTDDT